MVPKSPIEHPNKHHRVFLEDIIQVCLQFQSIPK